MSTHEPAGYRSALQRVSRLRGPARLYDCIACFGQARLWTYVGKSAEGQRRPFSNDPGDYVPMCPKCRAKYTPQRHRRPVKPEELEPVESVRKLAGVPRLPRRWDADIEAWAA